MKWLEWVEYVVCRMTYSSSCKPSFIQLVENRQVIMVYMLSLGPRSNKPRVVMELSYWTMTSIFSDLVDLIFGASLWECIAAVTAVTVAERNCGFDKRQETREGVMVSMS